MYSIALVIALALIFYGYKRWSQLPKEQRKSQGRKILIWATIAALVLLVATGRAHWLMGVLAALLAAAGRLVALAQYIPFLRRIFAQTHQHNQRHSRSGGESGSKANKSGSMSRAQAAAILGISESASESEIIAAHKRLMHKVHPDRGGTDELAATLNQAKDTLLS